MKTPDFVQKQYDRVLSDGLPGSNVNVNPTYDASFIAEGSSIPFGVVVSKGSSFGPPVKAKLGTTGIHVATAGIAKGTGVFDDTLASWKLITDGEFSLFIDGVAFDATPLDFSAVTDMDGVAAVIEAAIQGNTTKGAAFTAATVEYASDGQLVITSGTTGATSTVGYIDNVDAGSGTNILARAGLDSYIVLDGTAAVVAATVLGVTLRELTHEGGAGNDSGTTAVKEGAVGALRQDGAVKVLCTENATAGSDVYFADATGAICSQSGAGRTKLGTAKFMNTVSAGSVGVVDLVGLR